MNTLSSVGEKAKPAITSYLVCFARERGVEQICFLLAQYVAKSHLIPKSPRDITKLLANIQKKWLNFYFEKLKLFKDRKVYQVVNLSKK